MIAQEEPMSVRAKLVNVALAVAAAATLSTVASCNPSSAIAGGKAPICLDYPSIAMPAVVAWDGTPFLTSPTGVIVVVTDGQYPGSYVAYQVEYTVPSVPRAVVFPAGKLGNFVDNSILASVGIIRPPNPPGPPIVDGRGLAMMAEMARK
jgi:hypothetical protein